jgi:hypothetical protein
MRRGSSVQNKHERIERLPLVNLHSALERLLLTIRREYVAVFCINMYKSCNPLFDSSIILDGKILNYKVLDLVEHYNFDIERVSIQSH